ncbi:MAG: type II toxin-antitoxin system VapC family toxin [Thermodesulfobacteriota bacterium]|nr:type II toxin-antitoxin system VapC family toxin [Thermodesulfobacteriota bacterium]
MFVLDTNTLIYFFKGQGQVAYHLFRQPPQNIGIPAIVLFELEVGIARSASPRTRIRLLREMLSVINILPFAEEEAKTSANIRADLEKKGTPIGAYDILIAGTALANNGVLVTRNTKEFKRVKKLQIVNWYE